MAALRGVVCRMLAIGAILAGVGVGLAGAASAAPTIPGVPDCKDAPTAQLPGSGITGLPRRRTRRRHREPRDPFADHPLDQRLRAVRVRRPGLAHLRPRLRRRHARHRAPPSTPRSATSSCRPRRGVTAATNGLHNKVGAPRAVHGTRSTTSSPTVTHRLHDSIWTPWGMVPASRRRRAAAVLLACAADFPRDVRPPRGRCLVLAVVAGVAQYPTRVATFFDEHRDQLHRRRQRQRRGPRHLPAAVRTRPAPKAPSRRPCPLRRLAPRRVRLPTAPRPRQWGPALFKASAFTWAEAAQAAQDPDGGQADDRAEGRDWERRPQRDPGAGPGRLRRLQGKAGGRAGTGFMALLGAPFTALFRLVADIFVFAGLVMLRLLVMFFPAAAVFGVMAPMASIVRRVANMAGAAVVNVVAFCAGLRDPRHGHLRDPRPAPTRRHGHPRPRPLPGRVRRRVRPAVPAAVVHQHPRPLR